MFFANAARDTTEQDLGRIPDSYGLLRRHGCVYIPHTVHTHEDDAVRAYLRLVSIRSLCWLRIRQVSQDGIALFHERSENYYVC